MGDDALGERATVHTQIGQTLGSASRFPEAERQLDRATALLDRMPGRRARLRGRVLSERADLVRYWKNDLPEAERLSTQALDLYRKNGEPFLIADALGNLAVIKMHRNQLDEAIALYEEAIELTREVYGERHPHVAVRLENLGNVYLIRGELDKTNALLDEVLAIRESVYGKDSALAARTRFNMGVVAHARRRLRARLAVDRLDARRLAQEPGRAEPRLCDRAARARPRRRRSRRSRRARSRYEASLAIQDALAAPTAELRLKTLDALARVRCQLGSVDEGRQTAELALAALDRGNADHQKWIAIFESLIAKCGGGSESERADLLAPSRPGSASAISSCSSVRPPTGTTTNCLPPAT